jgi:hypothetical protein
MLTVDTATVRPEVVEEIASAPLAGQDCLDCLLSPTGLCRDHGVLVIELL